eukprot:gene49426-60503_t
MRARFWLAAGACALMLAGCAQFKYYFQAAQGQYALWSEARPIEDWLGDPATDAKLKARLEKALLIRRFAVKELGLPDTVRTLIRYHNGLVLVTGPVGCGKSPTL